MLYMGSKNRIAKHILPIMLVEKKPWQCWVEPFVGGANMIDKVNGCRRIGNDINKQLIALFKALQGGWVPPEEVSKEMYYDVKASPSKYADEVIGFVGFLCSFGGKWWGGYAANSEGRNYAAAGSRSLVRQAQNLVGVEFCNSCYLDMEIPAESLIYCDPPYEGATKYRDNFDHEVFWQWCRDKAVDGHTVFVSEYNAPNDFECVKEIAHKTILNKNRGSARVEKLFRPIKEFRR